MAGVREAIPRGYLIFVIAAISAINSSGTLRAQGRNDAQFLSEAFTRVTDLARFANTIGGYGYNDTTCLLGGWISVRSSIDFTIDLKGGVDYMLLAGGDADAQDVRVLVLQNGKVLAQDQQPGKEGVVKFRPAADGQFTLRCSLVKSRNNLPCVCVMAILKKGGWNIALKNLDTAAGDVVKVLGTLDRFESQRSKKRAFLFNQPNQWAVFGHMLRQGASDGVVNLNLGNREIVFYGTGDLQAQDIDLVVKDKTGKTVASDVRPQLDALIVRNVSVKEGPYGVTIHNARSRGAALAIIAIFDIRIPPRVPSDVSTGGPVLSRAE